MIRWLTVSEAARYFGKDQSMIRRWCYSGEILLENGFLVHRDFTGHWKIGIPSNVPETVNTVNSVTK